MVTRRQFGLWTTSALLVGPSVARAGGKAEQAVQAAAPSEGLDALTITGAVKSRDDKGGVVLQLSAANAAKKGLTVAFDVGNLTLVDADASVESMAWMNNDHPYSRRIAAPSFVDLPGEETTLCGVVNTAIPPEWLEKTGLTATFTLFVNDGKGASRQIELSVPLDGTKASS